MSDHVVHPIQRFSGTIQVPGDKSISQRVAMLSGLCTGTSTIRGYLQSEDCLNTLSSVCALGPSSEWEGDVLKVTGAPFRQPDHTLDMGNSGTGIRLLSGLLAGFPLDVTLTGDESLCGRPMTRISNPLSEMGADIECLKDGVYPPIRVRGGGVKPIEYTLPMASAQVKSCVLLAGLHVDGDVVVHEPSETRNHTENMFKSLGVDLAVDGLTIRLKGYGKAGPDWQARDWQVPSDFSSAAFWLMAAATKPGSELTLTNVGLNPRRTAFINVLQRMGADLTITESPDSVPGDPHGDIVVRGGQLKGTEVLKHEIANLIDELPLMAAAGALAEGETVISHAEELRVKESDRISTMVTNLRNLGVRVEELDDGMIVTGPNKIVCSGPIKSFHDHRIAMSNAILAMHADSPVKIENTACIQTSYPQFWDHAQQLGGTIECQTQ